MNNELIMMTILIVTTALLLNDGITETGPVKSTQKVDGEDV